MGIFGFLKKTGVVQAGGTSYTVKGGKEGLEYKNKDGKDVTDQVMKQDLRNSQNETSDIDSGFSGTDEN